MNFIMKWKIKWQPNRREARKKSGNNQSNGEKNEYDLEWEETEHRMQTRCCVWLVTRCKNIRNGAREQRIIIRHLSRAIQNGLNFHMKIFKFSFFVWYLLSTSFHSFICLDLIQDHAEQMSIQKCRRQKCYGQNIFAKNGQNSGSRVN